MPSDSPQTTRVDQGHNAVALSACHMMGMPKSGTTLLLALLDGHPNLAVFPEELRFYSYAHGVDDPVDRLLSSGGLKILVQGGTTTGLGGDRNYDHVDRQAFSGGLRKLAGQGVEGRELLCDIMELWRHAGPGDADRKTMWIEKSPGNEYFLPLIVRWFGKQARLLYMLRDPRDVFSSLAKARQHAQQILDPDQFALQWGFSVEIARFADAHYPGFVIVRYEDLVRQPEVAMRHVAGHLGLDFVPSLLTPTRAGRPWRGNSMHDTAFTEVAGGSIGIFQDRLEPSARRTIESRLGIAMRRHGYDAPARHPRGFWDIGRQRLRRALWQKRLQAV